MILCVHLFIEKLLRPLLRCIQSDRLRIQYPDRSLIDERLNDADCISHVVERAVIFNTTLQDRTGLSLSAALKQTGILLLEHRLKRTREPSVNPRPMLFPCERADIEPFRQFIHFVPCPGHFQLFAGHPKNDKEQERFVSNVLIVCSLHLFIPPLQTNSPLRAASSSTRKNAR